MLYLFQQIDPATLELVGREATLAKAAPSPWHVAIDTLRDEGDTDAMAWQVRQLSKRHGVTITQVQL